MKKTILIFAAMLMVVSGVAAVSAYEAHTVNVKAKVENAIELSSYTALEFGTVFPEEWIDRHTTVQFSSSFNEQETRHFVDFEVWAGWKLLSDNGTPLDPADDTYYPWLGKSLYVELNTGNWGYVGSAPAGPPGVVQVMDYSGTPVALVGTIDDTTKTTMDVAVWLDVPVFADFYIPATDVDDKDRDTLADTQLAGFMNDGSSGDDVKGLPSQILPPGDPWGTAYSLEMGVDLIIQVSDIYAVAK